MKNSFFTDTTHLLKRYQIIIIINSNNNINNNNYNSLQKPDRQGSN